VPSIGRKPCDKDTEENEDIERPGENIEHKGRTRASILKNRKAGGAVEGGDEAEAENLECSVKDLQPRNSAPDPSPPTMRGDRKDDGKRGSSSKREAQL